MITVLLFLLVVAITLFAARTDYKYYQKRLRAGLILFSGVLLAGFLAEPQLWPAGGEQYILFTSDVTPDEVRSSAPDSAFFLSEPVDVTGGAGSYLSSAAYLTDFISEGSVVSVRGKGTDSRLPLGFHWINKLTEPQPGIFLEEAPFQVVTGQQFRIAGKLIGYKPGDSLAIFRDGVALEFAEPDDDGRFELDELVRSAGPVQYQIEWTGTDTTIIEPWYIRAVEPERLRIGALLYSPSFEINYVTESFGSRGHAIAMRTRIGDERFRFDDLNDPPVTADEIFNGVGDFDMLILDAREFAELDGDQQNSIKKALEEGMDLLLIPPADPDIDSWTEVMNRLTGQQIGLAAINRLEKRQWLPDDAKLDGRIVTRLPLLNLDFENLPDRTEIVHRFEEEVPVAIRIPVDNGSVSVHLFHQTYRLLLRGEQELYNRLWADYFDRIITIESHFLEISEKTIRHHQPVTMVSSHDNISVRHATENEQLQLPVAYGVDHPASGYTLFWPEETGWHRAEAGEITRWFYVYDKEWEFSRIYRNYLETSRQINEQQGLENGTVLPQKKSVPEWVWLLGFLAIQAYLWIERKMN